jgi:hypothetical protein
MRVFRERLYQPHGVSFDTFCIDMGWSDLKDPWEIDTSRFPEGFTRIRQAAEQMGSHLGLWISPSSGYPGAVDNSWAGQHGFEVFNNAQGGGACLAGEHYRDRLQKSLVRMVADYGVRHIKLDGYRFECPAADHGHEPGLLSGEAIADGMISVARAVRKAAPDTWMETTCFGWNPSPWWLMHVDVLSLVNSRDGAPGERTEQMCYRDALYYQLTEGDRNQVPLCSFFNHEPAKDGTRFSDQTLDGFRDYLFMALSRGTLSVELYFQVRSLKPEDYDVIAEGLKWLYHVAPAFQRSRMHGGGPLGPSGAAAEKLNLKNVSVDQIAQVYGYTGWTDSRGYVSIHNPTSGLKSYSFCLDRNFGLVPGSGPFTLSSPMAGKAKTLKKLWNFGETVTVELKPREVIVLDFDRP